VKSFYNFAKNDGKGQKLNIKSIVLQMRAKHAFLDTYLGRRPTHLPDNFNFNHSLESLWCYLPYWYLQFDFYVHIPATPLKRLSVAIFRQKEQRDAGISNSEFWYRYIYFQWDVEIDGSIPNLDFNLSVIRIFDIFFYKISWNFWRKWFLV
jgi:hypothetical protein